VEYGLNSINDWRWNVHLKVWVVEAKEVSSILVSLLERFQQRVSHFDVRKYMMRDVKGRKKKDAV